MEFVINATQLRKALLDIENAEKNGFMYCEAVFEMVQVGRSISNNKAEYLDLFEKAHPTDGSLNWGRFQGVTKRNKFIDGKLVKIKDIK